VTPGPRECVWQHGAVRPPSEVLRRALALVAAVALLAGCRLDVGAEVVMGEDGSGTVTITVLADAELLAKAPGALADLRLDDLTSGGWTVDGPAAVDAGAQRLVVSKPFTSPEHGARVLGELSGPAGPLRDVTLDWARTFGTVRSAFAATARLDGGLAGLGDADLMTALGGRVGLSDRVTGDVADGLKLTITARLPGRVTDTNGTVAADGASVSWTPDLRAGQTADLRASFVRRDEAALSARTRAKAARIGLAVWGGVLALAVVGGGLWLASRRRPPARPGPPPSPYA
jgi:hypothetical protein